MRFHLTGRFLCAGWPGGIQYFALQQGAGGYLSQNKAHSGFPAGTFLIDIIRGFVIRAGDGVLELLPVGEWFSLESHAMV